MNYYGLSGKMSAQVGKQDQLTDILLQAAKLLEANPDCIHYIVSKMDDKASVWVNEVWTSKAAHDQSLAPQDIRDLVMTALPLLAGKPEKGTELMTVGGKGIVEV